MTKKLLRLLAVGLFGVTTIHAASFSPCPVTNGPVSATSNVTGGTPGIAGVNPSYTCSFSIPAGAVSMGADSKSVCMRGSNNSSRTQLAASFEIPAAGLNSAGIIATGLDQPRPLRL
jgi:hypothetical protein